MAISIERTHAVRARPGLRLAGRSWSWQWPGLAGVLAVAACLNVLRLWNEGYANTYYAATVRSMLTSWHNFFYASFDPGGFVTVDKPPLGFWIQTASARLLGFHGWSLLLPQALAGIASVAVLFFLIRRSLGPVAGLLAALALAVSPISVATSRNNTIDSQLVLTSLFATWAVLKAAESGRVRFLLLGMALVGLGFNIKTLEALLVLPALIAVYCFTARAGWRKRVVHLAAAGVVLAVVSLSWMTAVDLTPASQRPYIGSSQHNSELELALGYNGIQRLLGQSGGPGSNSRQQAADRALADRAAPTAGVASAAATDAGGQVGGPQPAAGGASSGGPGGTGENGPAGVFRLLDAQLGGQIDWLIPVALLGLLAAWRLNPRRHRFDPARQTLIVFGLWFLTCAGFFSKALFFHRYYLSMMAPAVAALFGISGVALWRSYRGERLRGWLLPIALAVAAGVQVYILRPYTGWNGWLTPIVVAPCVIAALVLAAARLQLRLRLPAKALASAAAIGVLALLVAPAVWAGETVRSNTAAGGIPSAGPAVRSAFGFGGPSAPPPIAATSRADDGQGTPIDATVADGGFAASSGDGFLSGAAPVANGGPGGPGGVSKQLEQFLLANQGSARYLVAVSSAGQAEQLILDTGKPVMALGGFSGGDPILTLRSFIGLVKRGDVRYIMLGGMRGPGGGSSEIGAWVQSHGTQVSAGQLQSGSMGSDSAATTVGFGGQLYDLAGAAAGS